MITDKVLSIFFEEHKTAEIIMSDYDRLMQDRRDMFARMLLSCLIC